MRAAVGVALVIVCLGLAGCSLFGKKQAARTSNPKPFLGSETPTKTDTAAAPKNTFGPLPGANGTLAGRVVIEATEQPIKAYILIKNLEHEEAKTATLDLWTDESGYFIIPRLNVGEQYELVVRAKDSGDLISRKVFAKPPQPTLLIRLDKRFTNSSTPPLPGAPTMPEKKSSESGESSKERTPAASLGFPEKLPERDAPPRADLAAPMPASGSGAGSDNGNNPNPANIADSGFQRLQPPSVPADIPNKAWPPPVPREPQWQKAPDEGQPRTAPVVPSTPGSVRLPNLPTLVPSCGLYGNRLDNLALRDVDGNVWEYKRDRRGRLLLLDFWYHNCGPCLQAIPHLCALQRDYGPYGLEVVGIACETGPLEQQCSNVRATRGRYQINYKTLLSGGGPEHCPVMKQFRVEYFPLLVLIDTDGTILWHSSRDGMDDREHYKLKKMINDRLVTRQGPP